MRKPGQGAGAKLPTFWVAPLEAGGCPLLSPPNMIHLVLTVRDCVMVEERRLSLMFLDEVGAGGAACAQGLGLRAHHRVSG